MAKKKRKKKPKAAFEPSSAKVPRTSPLPNIPSRRPSWHFGHLDTDGPWCWKKMSQNEALDVLQSLQAFESMAWQELEGRNHHAVSIDQICPEAQKRLQDIGKDDVDTIFSLRIGSLPRVIGIRVEAGFYFLWWDPLHQVCPSTKKRT